MHDLFYAMLHFSFCKAVDSNKRLIHLKCLKSQWDLLCALWIDAAIVCLIVQQQRKFTTGPLADLSSHIRSNKIRWNRTTKEHWHFCLAQESSFQQVQNCSL